MAKKVTHAEMVSYLASAWKDRALAQGWKKGSSNYIAKSIEYWLGATVALRATNSEHAISDNFLVLWVACGHDTDALILKEWAMSIQGMRGSLKVHATNSDEAVKLAKEILRKKYQKELASGELLDNWGISGVVCL